MGISANGTNDQKYLPSLRKGGQFHSQSSFSSAVIADSMAKIVLDNNIALDYLLAEQGSVCVIINMSCCTWKTASGEVKTQ